MTHVKICGIRRPEESEAAVAAGADLLGFNFWSGTVRYISPSEAAPIIRSVPKEIWTVGVFVDEPAERLLEVAEQTGVMAVQLHGSESPEYLASLGSRTKIKAIKVGADFHPEELSHYASADAFLLDSFVAGEHGGTGRTFEWRLASQAATYGKIILSGGLNAKNVAEAIRQVRPWGVDVCSGVESEPGRKDPERIRELVRAVRQADSRMQSEQAATGATSERLPGAAYKL